MILKPSSTFNGVFNFNTFAGGETTATSVTGAIWVNGAVDGAVTVTVTEPATGQYKLTGTLGAYSSADEVQLIATATYGGITYNEIVWSATIDTSLASDVASTLAGGSVVVASVSGAVGSVTGNIGGNVAGSVGSVVGAVGSVTGAVGSVGTGGITAATFAANALDAVWSTTSRTVTGLTAAAVANIWDALLTGITTASSIGKLIKDYLDAAISSRLASASYSAPPSAASVADAVWDEATSGHQSAGTTGLALTSASAPTAAAVADAVWDEVLSGHAGAGSAGLALTSATAPSAASVADAVWDEALSGHVTGGSAGAALAASGAAADPWAKTLAQLALYDAETAARLWVKLNVGEADDTVIVVPAAPTTANKCRVFGYMEDPSGAVAANVDIVFELQAPVPTKGNKMIAGRKITVTTDSEGRISDGTNAWKEFNRNDLLTPAGTYYQVRCKELRMDLPIYLDDTTFNLATMVTELSGAGVISTTDRSNRWIDHPDIADQEGGTANKVLYVYDSTDSGLAGLYRWSLDEVQPADGVDYIDATSGGQWVIVVHF